VAQHRGSGKPRRSKARRRGAGAGTKRTTVPARTAIVGGAFLGQLYWTTSDDGTIWQANLDGSSPQTLATGQDDPWGVAVSPVVGVGEGGVRTRALGHRAAPARTLAHGSGSWARGTPRPGPGSPSDPAEAGPGAGRIATTQHRSAGPPGTTAADRVGPLAVGRPAGRPLGNRDRWSGQRQKGWAASAMPSAATRLNEAPP